MDLDTARDLGSATLHEAAGRTGDLPPAILAVDPTMRTAGSAFTVRSPPGDNLWLHRAIYAAAPGDVLGVATGDTAPEWGYWGEIMSEAARARHLAGLVLEGGSRDSDLLATIGFPVFSLGRCIRGTGKDATSTIGALGAPVTIGRVGVAPGDLVVGDRDGVVVVGADAADAVVAAGAARTAKEHDIVARLRAGERTLDLYDLG